MGLEKSEIIHSVPSNPKFFAVFKSFCQLLMGKYCNLDPISLENLPMT